MVQMTQRQDATIVVNIFGEEPLDQWQPGYHVAPRANWLNDPNGCEFDGTRYRVAFQHNPGAPRWGDMSWGVATSKDLVKWDRSPTILTSPRPDYESFGAWSGNILDDEYFVYSCAHHLPGGKTTSLCLAEKKGGKRVPENPILDAPKETNGDWRDPAPFDWNGRSFVALGASLQGKGVVLLAERTGPRSFQHIDEPFFQLPEGPPMFECPDIVRLTPDIVGLKLSVGPPKSKDVIILGTFGAGKKKTPVFQPFRRSLSSIRTTDGTPTKDPRCGHTPPVWQRPFLNLTTLDCGDAYAGQSVKGVSLTKKTTTKQQHMFFAWVSDNAVKKQLPYNGALTLPRILMLDPNNVGLRYRLAPELDGLRLQPELSPSEESCRLTLPEDWGNRFEVATEIEIGSVNQETKAPAAATIMLKDGDDHIRMLASIQVQPQQQRTAHRRVLLVAHFFFDKNKNDEPHCTMRAALDPTGSKNDPLILKTRLFVDGSLIEWDLGDGASACATRHYTPHTLTQVQVSAVQPSTCRSLRAWRLGLLT